MEQKIIKISIEEGNPSEEKISEYVDTILNDEIFKRSKQYDKNIWFSTTSRTYAKATKYKKSISIKIWYRGVDEE